MGENEQGGEVRIKLVIDDQSTATTIKIKEEMEEISAKTNLVKFFSQDWQKAVKPIGPYVEAVGIAAGTVVTAFTAAAAIAEVIGHAALEAAVDAEKQERAMSGILGMLDREKHTRAEINEYVVDTREELENSAIAMGESTEKVVGAYQAIVERGNVGSEKAKELAEDMALVGRITHGGMEGLAQGFSMMEMGIVRARNPLVQLIAATGTLHGNAKAVAQQMQKMTPEAQMELAEKAIEKQAEMMKGGGGIRLTLPQLETSFKGVREQFFTTMGAPMLESLIPPLSRMQNFLMQNKEAINGFAASVGTRFATFIDAVAAAAEGVYTTFAQDWAILEKGFNEVFGDWEAAWNLAIGDTASIKKDFAQMTDDFMIAMRGMMDIVKAMGEVAMDIKDVVMLKKAGTTQANVQEAAMRGSQSFVGAKGDEQFFKEVEHFKRLSELAGSSQVYVQAQLDAAVAQHDQWKMLAAKAGEGSEKFADAFESASMVHATAFEKTILEGLHGKGEEARATLQATADKLKIGFDDFMKTVAALDPKLAEELRKEGKIKTEGGIKGEHPVNFNNNTFNIKQDFKDQDPDRIAIVFRKDLVKHATANAQSRLAQAGGF